MAFKRGGKPVRMKTKHPKFSSEELLKKKSRKKLKNNAYDIIKFILSCKEPIHCKFACCWKKIKLLENKEKNFFLHVQSITDTI